jgi:hypothetical protein
MGGFPDDVSRERWRAAINAERTARIEQYRQKTAGPQSPWLMWRGKLPPKGRLQSYSLILMHKWASFRGARLDRVRAIRRLNLQLVKGLYPKGTHATEEIRRRWTILQVATILDETVRTLTRRCRAQAYAELLSQLPAMPGMAPEILRSGAAVAFCQRAKFPCAEKGSAFEGEKTDRPLVMELAGILRLARVMSGRRNPPIQRIEVRPTADSILVVAEGYSDLDPLAEKIAKARYLLEYARKQPVLILPNFGDRRHNLEIP